GIVVAVSDHLGGVFRADGLNIPALVKHVAETGHVAGFPDAEPISNAELLTCDCDVLIPAAVGHVIDENNAREIRAKYVIEAANGPVTAEGDDILLDRGILCVPDIFAN